MNLTIDQGYDTFVRRAFTAPILTQEEEFGLAVKVWNENCLESAHRLIDSFSRYVIKIASGYKNYGLPVQDLVQEGVIGLMVGIKRFDPFKGNRLSTYVGLWVKWHIHEFILRNWRIVRVVTTKAKRSLFFKLRSAKKGLTLSQEEAVDLASKFETDVDTIREMDAFLGDSQQSLNIPINQDGIELVDLLPSREANPEQRLLAINKQKTVKDALRDGFNALSDRERLVISNRYTEEPKTFDEIAKGLGISRERVRQIEAAAIKKMKNVLISGDLQSEIF